MKQVAFYFDSNSCSGCKACQIACKDEHGLEPGQLWRRVYEVSGGEWRREGAAWISTVFAYNLSIACNHCEKPICVEVCPTAAIAKRADGIVAIDAGRCTGCRYCSWACPYGAPQFDPARGKMAKCDFCCERLDRGLPPVCVAACPLRSLDFGELDELELRYGRTPAIYPLPDETLTSPALVITPHHQAGLAQTEPAQLINGEETISASMPLQEIRRVAREAALP